MVTAFSSHHEPKDALVLINHQGWYITSLKHLEDLEAVCQMLPPNQTECQLLNLPALCLLSRCEDNGRIGGVEEGKQQARATWGGR